MDTNFLHFVNLLDILAVLLLGEEGYGIFLQHVWQGRRSNPELEFIEYRFSNIGKYIDTHGFSISTWPE